MQDKIQQFADQLEQAVADLRSGAEDAVNRALQAVADLGDRAQETLDERTGGGTEPPQEPTA